MQNIENVIKIEMPALAKYGGIVRDAVYGIALRSGLSIEDSEDIRLSVGEAFTNAVQYAYGGETAQEHIAIICNTYSDRLEVTVQDYGRGFTEDDKPHSNDVGIGLGITFIQSLMDEVTVNSELGKGTAIIMIKKV
ncbi:MAG: ATP-binding protein [Candidatus Margulisiibacteriota bacterium]